MQNPQNLKLMVNLLSSLLVDLVSSLLNQQNLPQVKLSFALLLYRVSPAAMNKVYFNGRGKLR
jgi:hypothetical protein